MRTLQYSGLRYRDYRINDEYSNAEFHLLNQHQEEKENRQKFFFLRISTDMKKQTRRKSLKTEPSNVPKVGENSRPVNSIQASFIQAKPSFEMSGPDLCGIWKTCGENICLERSSESDMFQGRWGVHTMKFKIDGDSIPEAYLGNMKLMFDGVLRNPNTIELGNGQVWTRP